MPQRRYVARVFSKPTGYTYLFGFAKLRLCSHLFARPFRQHDFAVCWFDFTLVSKPFPLAALCARSLAPQPFNEGVSP